MSEKADISSHFRTWITGKLHKSFFKSNKIAQDHLFKTQVIVENSFTGESQLTKYLCYK